MPAERKEHTSSCQLSQGRNKPLSLFPKIHRSSRFGDTIRHLPTERPFLPLRSGEDRRMPCLSPYFTLRASHTWFCFKTNKPGQIIARIFTTTKSMLTHCIFKPHQIPSWALPTTVSYQKASTRTVHVIVENIFLGFLVKIFLIFAEEWYVCLSMNYSPALKMLLPGQVPPTAMRKNHPTNLLGLNLPCSLPDYAMTFGSTKNHFAADQVMIPRKICARIHHAHLFVSFCREPGRAWQLSSESR